MKHRNRLLREVFSFVALFNTLHGVVHWVVVLFTLWAWTDAIFTMGEESRVCCRFEVKLNSSEFFG